MYPTKRTYKSRKDVAGVLDPKDITSFNGQSSIFDAFYIQNLKQSKQKMSYGNSNQFVTASKKLRKRKYTKRIINNANSIVTDSPAPTYLTPDKSIRVNKPFDPFDALFDSLLNTQVEVDPNMHKNEQPTREPKLYTRRKKKNKPKRINYSTSSTDSEKENFAKDSNVTFNTTDIKEYQLLIEKEVKPSKCVINESINNINLNISELQKFKKMDSSSSLGNLSLNRSTLTDKIQLSAQCLSPISSTPFKEKYRSKSIYKFSPIVKIKSSTTNSVFAEEINSIHNNSHLLLKNNMESEPELQISSIKNNNNDSGYSKATALFKLSMMGENLYNTNNNSLGNNIHTKTYVEVDALSNSEMEPFVGFSISHNNKFETSIRVTANDNKTNEAQSADNIESNKSNSLEKSLSIIDLINDGVYKDKSVLKKDIADAKPNYMHSGSHNSISDTEDYKNYCLHSVRQTLYDTCKSETLQQTNRTNIQEPIVRLERMDDSIFFKYYQKRFDTSYNNTKTSDYLTNVDSNELSSSLNKTMISEDSCSIVSDSELGSGNDTTKSSFMENNDEISSSDQSIESTNEEDRCLDFVTTRKRTKPTSQSPTLNLSYSGNMQSDHTVCNDVIDNKSIYSNVSEKITLNFHNINSDEDTKTFLSCAEISSIENSNTESPISTYSDESNYYDNGSTAEDISVMIVSTDKRISNKNHVQYTERKCRTKLRNSKTKRTRQSLNSQDFYKYDIKTDSDVIVVTSSDSVPQSYKSSSPINDKSIPMRQKKVCRLDKVSVTNYSETDSDVKNVSQYAFPPHAHASDDTDSSCSGANTSCVIRKKKRVTRTNTKVYSKHCYEEENTQISNTPLASRRSSFGQKQRVNKSDLINSSSLKSKDLRQSFIKCRKRSNKPMLEKLPETSILAITGNKPSIVLEPGKKWERSLSIYRRISIMSDCQNRSILDEPMQMKGRKYRESVINTMEMQDFQGSLHNESIHFRRSTLVPKPSRSSIKLLKDPNITRVSLYTTALYDDLKGFLSDDCDDTIVGLSKLSIADAEPDVTVLEVQNTSNRLTTARDYVLRRCNQTDAILFDECYPDTVLKNCHKIGEGVYGEVFLWRDRDGRARVMKIVPIAGNVKVNGESQKDFNEIISEIVIAMELSAIRAPIADIERHVDEGKSIDALDLHAIENATDVFNEVLAVRCVYGSYPLRLLDLWDLYDECKGSENDNPAILPPEQQYLVLELANAGLDLESYQFNNAEQAHALFLQVAFGLAVGEESYQFEHRDLHWGNVLISPTDQKFATFVLRGRGHRVPRCGVSATIIDYSLSRISLPLGTPADCAALYNDLAHDEGLFEAIGDYQFEVYRLMRDKLGNDWKNFEPYTNILWLHYIVDKMITALRYKRTNTKIHKHYIGKLKSIKNRILDYKSTVEFVLTDNEV